MLTAGQLIIYITFKHIIAQLQFLLSVNPPITPASQAHSAQQSVPSLLEVSNKVLLKVWKGSYP